MDARCERDRRKAMAYEGAAVNVTRFKLGLTFEKLADRIDMPCTSLRSKIKAKYPFTEDELKTLARVLCISEPRLLVKRRAWEKEHPEELFYHDTRPHHGL